jgi:hypothetical protein
LGFCTDEIHGLLDTIEEINPVCGDDWDAVATVHHTKFPE